MSWKDWPYWLKAGIIGLSVGISLLILFVFLAMEDRYFNSPIIIIFAPIILAITGICGENNPYCAWTTALFVGLLLYPLFFFLIGVLIGRITLKLRSK
ncbi:MAG: hypothetical protein AABX33_06955 [Nanoarchaeota archaeon]